jgi:hypothetical protein
MRHYRFDEHRQVACTVSLDDDLVVTWIPVAAADDERVDLELLGPDDSVVIRADDVPLDRARGELVMAEAAETLLPLPDIVLRLRLTATGPRGRRDLGVYVYDHSAPPPPS